MVTNTTKESNFTIKEIQRALSKLDVDTSNLIYSTHKMNELVELMSDDGEFCKYIKNMIDYLRKYKKIADGLSKMKSCLDKNRAEYTDEEITKDIVDSYKEASLNAQNIICEMLGLVRRADVPEPKEEPVTLDKILDAYNEMSTKDKLKLDTAIRNKDNFNISCQKLKNAWSEMKSYILHIGAGGMH